MNIQCPPNTLGKFSQVVNVYCLQPWDDFQNFLCIVVFGKSSKGSCVSHGPCTTKEEGYDKTPIIYPLVRGPLFWEFLSPMGFAHSKAQR